MSIRSHAVWAVLARNFKGYFGSPTGYLFITAFIIGTAFVAFFSDAFFSANLADLATLNTWMPWLLVVFIPAVTMSSWAEERKLGTSELLLTLPVYDIEVVLGKYLAALAVFFVALVFSLSHVVVLEMLGAPDLGLLLANYLGYFLIGAALIPIGLAASSLTGNTTVAFIIGALFCAAMVAIEQLAALLFGTASRLVQGIGVEAHFENFKLGIITLPDVFFYVLLAITVLYVNMVMLGRRHWLGGRNGPDMVWHFLGRTVAIFVIAFTLTLLAGRFLNWGRLDMTSEGINSPARQTLEIIGKIEETKTIDIRCYVSPTVPEDYVQQRETLLRTLRAFKTRMGNQLRLGIYDVELYSDAASDAKERFGIEPQQVEEQSKGRQQRHQIFMGVVVSCGAKSETIPFVDRGMVIEYELCRAIRSVIGQTRRKVGILRTEAAMLSAADVDPQMAAMGMGNQGPNAELQAFVEELRKQYEVVEADPASPIKDIDVLIAPQPTNLQPEQIKNLEAWVRGGGATLFFVDPYPMSLVDRNPYSPYAPPMVKMPGHAVTGLLSQLGLRWNNAEVVCDASMRFERMRELPESIVFANNAAGCMSTREAITKNLSWMVMLFTGSLEKVPDSNMEITPLITTSADAGTISSDDQRRMMMGGKTGVSYVKRNKLTLAARVSGTMLPLPADNPLDRNAMLSKANVIVITDLDMIGRQFFEMRKWGDRDYRFDNIAFVLNCVDQLAGDNDLIAIRGRQAKYRVLTTIETQRKNFREESIRARREAEKKAEEARNKAKSDYEAAIKAIDDMKGIDDLQRQILKAQTTESQMMRQQATNEDIDKELNNVIEKAKTTEQNAMRRIENNNRIWALLLPPLPAIMLGVIVLVIQLILEQKGIPLTRSMRQTP